VSENKKLERFKKTISKRACLLQNHETFWLAQRIERTGKLTFSFSIEIPFWCRPFWERAPTQFLVSDLNY